MSSETPGSARVRTLTLGIETTCVRGHSLTKSGKPFGTCPTDQVDSRRMLAVPFRRVERRGQSCCSSNLLSEDDSVSSFNHAV